MSGYTRRPPQVPAEAAVRSRCRAVCRSEADPVAGSFSCIKVCPLDQVSVGVAPSYTGRLCFGCLADCQSHRHLTDHQASKALPVFFFFAKQGCRKQIKGKKKAITLWSFHFLKKGHFKKHGESKKKHQNKGPFSGLSLLSIWRRYE